MAVLHRVLRLRYHGPAGSLNAVRPELAATGLSTEVRHYLAKRYRDSAKLDDIAQAMGCSVFHLCRVFRREAGTTIHAYRLQLRLRRSLEMIAEPGCELTYVALHLGFSSHSHFTAMFRQTFGITPSEFRRRPSPRRIRELTALVTETRKPRTT